MSLKDLQNVSFGEKVIELKNISLAFGGVKALTDVSFDVKKGEVLKPTAYNSLNVGNIVSVFEALQSGMNSTAKAGAWKAKLATGDEATKEVQEEMLALLPESQSHTVQVLQLIFHEKDMPEEKTKTPNVKVQNSKLGVFIIYFLSALLFFY